MFLGDVHKYHFYKCHMFLNYGETCWLYFLQQLHNMMNIIEFLCFSKRGL